jgi:hypothetical protein
VSDIVREALEAYLGLRPTEPGQVSDTPDTVSDLAARVNAVVSDIASLQERLERLDAYLTTRTPRVRQRPTKRPTPPPPEPAPAVDTRQARTAGGQRKLTPRQVRALRDKHRRGVPVPALMDEYGISRASVFRYLQSDKRSGEVDGP